MVRELSPEEVDVLLREARFASLGCHANGETYVVPISFVFDGKRVLGQTKPGKKIDMMRKNPKVCVMVDNIKSIVDWQSVVVWGNYRELSGTEAATAMGALIDHLSPGLENEARRKGRSPRDVTPAEPGGLPQVDIVYEIEVQKATGRAESPDS
jgi:nitroimidazol reductase NimA-like FMN-containing flavoprotein (pyridoxamine 5'-phosphate oxidase superfamily)